jgi:hypothetical protein
VVGDEARGALPVLAGNHHTTPTPPFLTHTTTTTTTTHQQGEKAAGNAGIPFVVLGRKLSRQSLVKALAAHVDPHGPEAATAAAEAKAAAARAARNRETANAWFSNASSWLRRGV